jgi:DNA-binding MarR family transcriptional regulator
MKLYVDSNFYFNITSNIDYFKLINETPVQPNFTSSLENITFTLNLSKEVYEIGEPIAGKIEIYNNNSIDFYPVGNIQFPLDYYLKITSLDNSFVYGTVWFSNISNHLNLKAKNAIYLYFNITKIKWIYKDNYTYSKISLPFLYEGNYSIQGSIRLTDEIRTNNVTFRVIKNVTILDILQNVNVDLKLNKSIFNITENITGSINITNNNTFDVKLNNISSNQTFVFCTIAKTPPINYNETNWSERRRKIIIQRSSPILIKNKSTLVLEFKNKYFGDFKLGPGNYSMSVSFFYNSEIEPYKAVSNLEFFKIIDSEDSILDNISIELNLEKSKFYINESINGSISITNKNPFQINLDADFMYNRLHGEHLEIISKETKTIYNAILKNIKYPVEVDSNNFTNISFQFSQVIILSWENKTITFTNLTPGNYSIFAYFYYGFPSSYTKLSSNIETFRIITNITNQSINPIPLITPSNGSGLSSGYMVFYTTLGAVMIAILLTTAFITGTEVGKFGFFSAIAPLYTKKRRKKDENYGYNRGLIQGYIDGNPGESYNAIKRALELKNGTLAYYLKILSKEGKIRTERDGMYKRFYPTVGKSRAENVIIELSKIQQNILDFIKSNPGTTQTNIAKELGIIHSKLNYHISMLSDARLIKLEREGNATKCFVLMDNN